MRHHEIIRPLLWASVFCLLGLVMCAFKLCFFIAAAFLLAAFFISLLFTRKSLLPLLLALALSLGLTARYKAVEHKAELLREKYDGVEAMLFGEICSAPSVSGNASSAIIKTGFGLVKLTFYDNALAGCRIGDKIAVDVSFFAPRAARNDYAFDNANYLYSQRIYLCAVGSGKLRIRGRAKPTLFSLAAAAKEHSIRMGEKHFLGPPLALYCALTFGDRSLMEQKLKNDLSKAGLSHMAAVSGMHLSVVASIAMFLMSLLFGNGRISRFFTIVAIILFSLLTGGSISVMRACMTNVIFQFSYIIYRDSDGLTSLCTAFILMCFFHPPIIYNPSFLLSVSATLGILLFAQPMTALFDKLLPKLHFISSVLAVSLSAQTAAFPFLAYFYNKVSVYFLLANLITVPLLPFIMLCSLLLALLGDVPLAGAFLGKLCELMYGYICLAAEKIAALPHSHLTVGRPEIPTLIAYAGAVFAVFSLTKKKPAATALLLVLTLTAAAVGFVRYKEASSRSEICFLNVGRGDCVYIELHGRTTVLIDGGKNSSVVENYLTARGVDCPDVAVVTSVATEQLNGILALAAGGRLRSLYIPDEFPENQHLSTVEALARSNGCRVTKYKTGDLIYIDGLTLRPIDKGLSSVQLVAEYEGTKLLFCGNEYMAWESCDILRVPRHGSGSYNYRHEIFTCKPKYAVVTASGTYATEKSRCVGQLKDFGTDIYVPASEGTVTFILKDGNITVKTTSERRTLSDLFPDLCKNLFFKP